MTDVAPTEPDGPVGAALCPFAALANSGSGFQTMIEDCMLASQCSKLALCAFVGLLLCGQLPAQAQQFSADLVLTQGGAAPVPAGRLFVLDDKVRIETPELADGFFLIEGAKPAAYFVRPATRIYMDARQSSRLTGLFVSVDPDDPCRQWQAMARLAGGTDTGDWRCERVGEEAIGERSAVVYRAFSATHAQFIGWIDRIRKFPLRIKTEDGGIIAVENIRDDAQPASTLEIPSGFRKFDPEGLIQRIKQSDVWVEP
jgi:hypothetical protein